MKRIVLSAAFVALWMLLPAFVPSALACSCAPIFTTDSPVAAAWSSAAIVFSGRAVSGDRQAVRFQVDKVWKGAEASEITMLTGTQVYANGTMSMTSCDYNYSIGTEYVVYASQQLKSQPCSRTAPLSAQEVKDLDAVAPHKRVGTEARPCGGGTSTSASASAGGELRLVAANTNQAGMAAVRVALEGGGGQFGAVTDAAGRTAFTKLSPGPYKITMDAEGHTPRRLTVQVTAAGCVEAAVFLLQLPASPPAAK